jgi:hypothetical protein
MSETTNGAGREGGAELEAGHVIDIEIAERVMGWRVDRDVPAERGYDVNVNLWPPGWTGRPVKMHWSTTDDGFAMEAPLDAPLVPDYSTSIAAAWSVVEKLIEEGFCPALLHDDHKSWTLAFDASSPLGPRYEGFANVIAGEWADTAPLAICKAALLIAAHATPNDSAVTPSETAP